MSEHTHRWVSGPGGGNETVVCEHCGVELGTEVCGLQGNEHEGYCTCIKLKGHAPPHACRHGGWR